MYTGFRNSVTYDFDYFGVRKSVNAVGGIGFVYSLLKIGDELIIGVYETKVGKEKFCCALPKQISHV